MVVELAGVADRQRSLSAFGNLPASADWVGFGGSGDDWGIPLGVSIVNDLYLDIAVSKIGDSSSERFFVDSVFVTVYYTEA